MDSIFPSLKLYRWISFISSLASMITILSVICLFTLLLLYVIYKPPTFLIRYFQRRWPDVLWRISIPSKVIALTIDDGPSEYTDEIMRILEANGATATFFIIGSQIEG